MSNKVKGHSTELEVAFIQWVKDNAHDPLEAIDHFLVRSQYILDTVDTVVGRERTQIIERTRDQLRRIGENPVFTAQFPAVYGCHSLDDEEIRYTVSLTLGEHEAYWVGRVWADHEFLGEVCGSGSGPAANYMELARMHVESHVRCPGKLRPQIGKRLVGPPQVSASRAAPVITNAFPG